MTTRSVLIVDGDAVFLADAAADLRKRGYRVYQAVTLQEATACATAQKPDVVVVDGKLPGASGTEFVASLGSNHPAMKVVFVSHKLRDPESCRKMAREIGISLVVYKPLQPEELGLKIEKLFAPGQRETIPSRRLSTPPQAPESPETRPQISSDVRDLRTQYAETVPALFAQIGELLVNAVTSPQKTSALEEARRLSHLLCGRSGTLEFQEARAVSLAVEGVLQELLNVRRSSTVPLQAATVLKRERKPPSTPAQPSAEAPRTKQPSILVVDDDPEFLEVIAAFGRDNLIRVIPARNRSEALRLAQQVRIDAAVIDIYLQSGDNAFVVATELRALETMSELPIAFLSADISIPTRIAAVHSGASLFLDKPVTSTDFAAAVRRLVPEDGEDGPRVAILDDDACFMRQVADMLEAEHMRVCCIEDPTRLLESLNAFRPDVLLLDIVLPGVNGFDLCKVLRSAEQWRHLPVLFTTVQVSDEVLLKCYRAGGDDYITKPVIREELLARIGVRLDRLRLYRERADRDALTSLPTRRSFIELFKLRLAEGMRHSKPVTLCLLDLDHFKQVNDNYGHLAGDRVLARFGRLLASRFRNIDLRGRWGGEEFMLAFYNENAEIGKMVVNRVLEEFRKITFRGDHQEQFQITFSTGISTFPEDGQDFEELFKSVDAKLRLAKERGRDRIEI